MRVDLHTHTSASDGTLPPEQLVEQAHQAGVELLAITDHDSVAAFAALEVNQTHPLTLIPGTEISSYWGKMCVHILGLNVDIRNPVLSSGLAKHQQSRIERAKIIAQRLEKMGFADVLAGTYRIAGDAVIGRLHFAQYLVEIGAAKNYAGAFKKYLGNGKAGDVKSDWGTMSDAIDWISQAGGQAVLAHPAKYKLTHRKVEQLVTDFAQSGGHAIEVVSGMQDPKLTDRLARLANRHKLRASSGSDFHRPGQSWAALGAQPVLPAECEPVWEAWLQ
jgi:predicted metal-dependent phosphoesterase TrpH